MPHWYIVAQELVGRAIIRYQAFRHKQSIPQQKRGRRIALDPW